MSVRYGASVDEQIVLLSLYMRFLLQLGTKNDLQIVEPADNQHEAPQKNELPEAQTP